MGLGAVARWAKMPAMAPPISVATTNSRNPHEVLLGRRRALLPELRGRFAGRLLVGDARFEPPVRLDESRRLFAEVRRRRWG